MPTRARARAGFPAPGAPGESELGTIDAMRLSKLIADLPAAVCLEPGDPQIRAVVCDSRGAGPGSLFVAVRGQRADGHRYLEAAAAAGAAAALVEEEDVPRSGVVRVLVPDTEVALGRAAAAFWGHPSRQLRLVGITGTNGKTTTAYLIQHLLEAAGIRAGRMGTVSYAYPRGEEPAPLTTPDAPTLQGALARMVREGARAAVLEVSSHSLVRRRVEGCRFACAVFTNLTQDHLDYHGSMDAYFEAKLLLFARYARGAPAVVSAEDPYGERIRAQAEQVGSPVITFGLERGDVRLAVEALTTAGVRGHACYPGGSAPVEVPLVGEHNARNAACALAAAVALGLDGEAAARALARAPQVPGRVEAVPNGAGLSVFVDYAHTPDALYRVLEALRRLATGRLLCVFGCGGDRDRGKRPLMAEAAARWADALVLTADNSRSEPTAAILTEIERGLPPQWRPAADAAGLRENQRYLKRPDRREAIHLAVAAVQPGDALVIAGKGHETTQTLGERVLAFDDRREARAALAAREAA
ncbi:MAG: UDP-N-acetylmuramoyl-L-alanyl-D-glutamate--2,6-diaminopimelate ligase [Deferrisomatales bacterium]